MRCGRAETRFKKIENWFETAQPARVTPSRPAKRRPAYAVAAFCFLALLASLAPVYALSDHVVISEVIVDVTGPESAGEFVELYNPTGDTVAIGGWDIAYKIATGGSFGSVSTIPTGRTIAPFGYFLVGGDLVVPTPDYVDTSLGFAASGGHVALRNASNVIIDKVGYGNADSPESAAVTAPPTDQSVERKPGGILNTKGNGQDGDDNSADFSVRLVSEPQNSSSAREFPDSTAGTVSSAATFLKGIAATTNVTVTDPDRNNKGTSPETFTITVTSTIDTVGIAIAVKETADSASTFDLATAGGNLGVTLGASSASSRKIQVRALGDTITVSYKDPAPSQTATTTIQFLGLGKVVVNEVVFDPNGADQGNEWVELYNADTAGVDLSGWTLTDEDAGTVMEMPSGITLPVGAFLKWNVDTDGVSDTDFSDGCGTIFSGTATTVQLTNTNDQVSLYASTTRNKNTIVDFLQYSTNGTITEPSDAQNAVDAGIWPATDTYVNAAPAPEGASLRLLPDGNDNNRPADWNIDSSPTPCTTNAFVGKPTVPQNFDAVASIEKNALYWSASTAGSDPLAGYRVYRGLSASALSAIAFTSATSYTDTPATPGTAFYYAVKAEDVNGVQSDTSNIDSATSTAYTRPGAPQNLVAAGNPFSNDLSWDTPTAGSYALATYRIYRSTTSNVYADTYAEISKTKTKFSDTNVVVGTQYFYVVKATDTIQVASDTSNQATVVAQGYAPAPPLATNIQINEIMYDPAGSEPQNEWVELYNPTDTPIKVDSWIFADNVGTFRIPESTTIAAKAYFVLGYSVTAAGGNVDLIYGSSSPNIQLSNSGETVTIRTDTQIIDQVGYSSSWGGAEPKSLSRKFSGSPSNVFTNWGPSKASGGTPRAVNDVDTLPPLITHTPPARVAWKHDVGIHATITDNYDKDIATGNVTLYHRIQGETAYHSIQMLRFASTAWNAVVPAANVDTPVLEYYISAHDDANNFQMFASAETPQQATVVVIDTKLAINEILYDPADSEPQQEWVELYNYGATSLNISNWGFGTVAKTFVIPPGTTIGAGAYLLLKNTETAAGGVPGIVYGETTPGLEFQNAIAEITDQVIVKDPSGLIVDELNYSTEMGAQNISDPKNTTLERLDPVHGSNDRSNWIFSYQAGGTPGAANGFKFIRNFAMSKTLIDPTAGGDSVHFTFNLIVDTKAFVKIEIFSETGQLQHTINLDTAPDSGIYSYAFDWDGKDNLGNNILGILQVEPVATNARGEVCRQKVNDKTPYVPNTGVFSGGSYRNYTKTYFEYTFTKPQSVTYLFRQLVSGFDGPNTRYAWREVPQPSGRVWVSWDGRDDTGIIVSYNPLPLLSARTLLGNILISRKPLKLMGIEFAPRTSFNPNTESEAIRFDLTDSANVTVRIRRTSDGMLMRTIISSQSQPYGFNEVFWDGKDESSSIVADGLYVVEVHAESPVGREQATEFGEVYVRRGF